ncbi:hypothetical protein FHX81_0757 [Saccharothrix saharensis]|uniref:Uncharacterized protein n=1 Tax=Saccharothrix saharensis TaxID=571190 RepID=A0A543J6S3_9PSEU|nr:hypothetical protein [Saccharothrix saharensis]TQM78488.1 hypothetical protein FHX81_0757 [Saccharothrix saharensis]
MRAHGREARRGGRRVEDPAPDVGVHSATATPVLEVQRTARGGQARGAHSAQDALAGYAERWREASALPWWQPRSTLLREVDRTLRVWAQGYRSAPDAPANRGRLDQVLAAIGRWQQSKTGRVSARSAFVQGLTDLVNAARATPTGDAGQTDDHRHPPVDIDDARYAGLIGELRTIAQAERDREGAEGSSRRPDPGTTHLDAPDQESPAVGETGTEVDEAREWPGTWAREIRELDRGNNLLGPDNRILRRLRGDDPTKYTDHIRRFIASLADPAAPALDARDILYELRNEARTPAHVRIAENQNSPVWGGPSSLPTVLQNDLLELINAKLLWQSGDRRLHPWPFNEAAKKPDYLVGDDPAEPAEGVGAQEFYERAEEIGDHVRVTTTVSGERGVDQVVNNFGRNVASKLSTYADKDRLRVIVDLHENIALHPRPESSSGAAPTPEALRRRLLDQLRTLHASHPGDMARLTRVDAITPDGVLTFVPDDWTADNGPETSSRG